MNSPYRDDRRPGLGIRQGGKELTHCSIENGVRELRRELRQRDKDEATQMQPRMGKSQFGRVADFAAKEQQVDIESAGSPMLEALATQRGFDGQTPRQQIRRRALGRLAFRPTRGERNRCPLTGVRLRRHYRDPSDLARFQIRRMAALNITRTEAAGRQESAGKPNGATQPRLREKTAIPHYTSQIHAIGKFLSMITRSS